MRSLVSSFVPLYTYAALIIGFDRNKYFVEEGDGNVTLTMSTSGTTAQCNETEWMILLNTTDASAKCRTLWFTIYVHYTM